MARVGSSYAQGRVVVGEMFVDLVNARARDRVHFVPLDPIPASYGTFATSQVANAPQ
jgi:hypothetical protein